MGGAETERYYRTWDAMPNAVYVSGEYVDLFNTSDAMIHDCAGFMMEYLYTKKPVMFLSRGDVETSMSEFSQKCYQQHYVGFSCEDIHTFLDDIVLAQKDTMKDSRAQFYNTELLPPNNTTAAKNMYNEFLTIFET